MEYRWQRRQAEVENPGHKVCTNCKTLKPHDRFSKSTYQYERRTNKKKWAKRDGLVSWCKSCYRKNSKEHPTYPSRYIKRPEWVKPLHSVTKKRHAEWQATKYRLHKSGEIDAIGEHQEWQCPYCKTDIQNEYHIDHIYPIKHGGVDEVWNLQLTCETCNLKKNAKLPWLFATESVDANTKNL